MLLPLLWAGGVSDLMVYDPATCPEGMLTAA